MKNWSSVPFLVVPYCTPLGYSCSIQLCAEMHMLFSQTFYYYFGKIARLAICACAKPVVFFGWHFPPSGPCDNILLQEVLITMKIALLAVHGKALLL